MHLSPQYAFVTLVTSDHYLPGALVVAAALRELHPCPPNNLDDEEIHPREFHITCIVTPETVSVETLKLLRKTFDVVIGVEVIEEDTEVALNLLGRPDLKAVLTKLHVFRLKSYRKIVYLDADVLPLLPLSHLFHNTSSFAAVPDVGWPDIFNSGVLIFTPSENDFEHIMQIVRSQGSWDGGDQGVLNEWRGNDWERLSFTYNTTPTGAYTYAPAYSRFGSGIKIIHFIGPNKPWSQIPSRASNFDQSTASTEDDTLPAGSSYAYSCLLDRWFTIFDKYYRSAIPIFSATGSLVPATTFSEGIYENVWDSGATAIGKGNRPLELEELRRLALEGSGQVPTKSVGEGAYMTLPLEGRLDLMPPRRSHFRMLPSPPALISSTSNESTDSHNFETTVDISEPPELVVSKGKDAEGPCDPAPYVQWDPWTKPFPNAWDLVPGIIRRPFMFSRQRINDNIEKESSRDNIQPVYKNWEDKAESTSADGDDEAED